MNKSIFRDAVDYILVFLLIFSSGNPAWGLGSEEIAFVILFLLSAILFVVRRPQITNSAALFFFFVLVIFSLHYLIFGGVVIMSSIGQLLKVAIAFFLVVSVKDFYLKFVKIMVVLAAISLVFHIPTLLGLDLRTLFAPLKLPVTDTAIVHIGIHNFQRVWDLRNSGIFWEPGAYAGYIVITFMLALLAKISLPKISVFILVTALLTTQSTMGLSAAFILLSIYILKKAIDMKTLLNKLLVVGSMVMMGLCFVVIFFNVEFLGEKVAAQWENKRAQAEGYEVTRFGNVAFDIPHIAKRPILGWGPNPETRFYISPELEEFIQGQGVGLTAIMIKYGLLGFILLSFYIYRAFWAAEKSLFMASLYLLLVYALLMGEQFQNFPLFFIIPFLLDKYKLKKRFIHARPTPA